MKYFLRKNTGLLIVGLLVVYVYTVHFATLDHEWPFLIPPWLIVIALFVYDEVQRRKECKCLRR